jgi:hypothetical protein
VSGILEVKFQVVIMQNLTAENQREYSNHNTHPQISGNGKY